MEGGDSITQDKPIRPTIIEFNTQEEYDAFIEYATSTKPNNSVGMQKMRELMKNHKRAKERVSNTQMGATPILEGGDAERLLKSLENKPTEKSRENAKRLAVEFSEDR